VRVVDADDCALQDLGDALSGFVCDAVEAAMRLETADRPNEAALMRRLARSATVVLGRGDDNAQALETMALGWIRVLEDRTT
jgi:hypothetical protein